MGKMKLSEALELLKDQWIAFRIGSDEEDPEGVVVLHDADREAFRRELHARKIRGVYITYAGDVLPEGYAALF